MKIQDAHVLTIEVHYSRYACIRFCKNLSNKTCDISSRHPRKCNLMTLNLKKRDSVYWVFMLAGWVAR